MDKFLTLVKQKTKVQLYLILQNFSTPTVRSESMQTIIDMLHQLSKTKQKKLTEYSRFGNTLNNYLQLRHQIKFVYA